MVDESLLAAAIRYTPTGKSIVITGGTQGLGRAAIDEMGAIRARIFTCARSADDLQQLLEHCSSQGWDVKGIRESLVRDHGMKALFLLFPARVDCGWAESN